MGLKHGSSAVLHDRYDGPSTAPPAEDEYDEAVKYEHDMIVFTSSAANESSFSAPPSCLPIEPEQEARRNAKTTNDINLKAFMTP